jgi:hypothetical protein
MAPSIDAPSNVAQHRERGRINPIFAARSTTGLDGMAQSVLEQAKIRQNRDDGRPTEDDIARAKLGPRGEANVPDTAKMTTDSELQTPAPPDPGHTV